MFEGMTRGIFFLLALAFFLVSALVWHAFDELEPSEYIPLLIAVLSAFIGLTGVIITQARLKLVSIEDAHRLTKADIYFDFVNLVQNAMMAQKPEFADQAKTNDDMAKSMIDFKSKCLLWGSEEVLMAVSNFQTISKTKSDPKNVLRSVEGLYRAMRKDIGLRNSALPKDFFAKWPLSDPSEFDRL